MTQREKGYKWLTTDQLRALNERSIEINAHRSLNDEFFRSVDPQGRHVVEYVLPYGQSDNGPGHRLLILAKMKENKGADETNSGMPFARVMIDVEHGSLRSFTEQEDAPCPPLFEF